jgi:hypothetical protein
MFHSIQFSLNAFYRVEHVFDPFDVLRLLDGEDQPKWIAATPTIDDARALVQQLEATRSASYFIYAQKTGHTTVLKPGGIQIEIAPVLVMSNK